MWVGLASVAAMIIDCEVCTARPAACADCVVTFLAVPVGAPAGVTAAVELDAGERRALEVLAASGLVPPLRLDQTG